MRNLLAIIVALIGIESCLQPTQSKIYMIGDSTMANKEKLYFPERGWGQFFQQQFSESITIENYAKNGRSTRSFIYEGRWDSVYIKLHKGDYVIIQFGHNDGSMQKTERYATPQEYEYNLRKFIRETQLMHANPILATPIVRRRFDENHQFYDTHGVYPEIMRKLSIELEIPLLEMHKESMLMVNELGFEKSKKIYLHIEPNTFDSLPNGQIDNTHFSEFGAMEMAKIAAEEIRKKIPQLTVFLNK